MTIMQVVIHGIGFINQTFFCTFLQEKQHKYFMTTSDNNYLACYYYLYRVKTDNYSLFLNKINPLS